MNKKVLICSSPDLNYIDGSSIWAQTITLAFSESEELKVDFIAKSKPERYELYQPLLDKENVSIIDGTLDSFWAGKSCRRLSSIQLAELTVLLQEKEGYDAIVVRGFEIAQKLLEYPHVLQYCWLYLTDIPQNYSEYTSGLIEVMDSLAKNSQFVLCQSQGFIDLWKRLSPSTKDDKYKIYSPVIPDVDLKLTPVEEREKKVVYAGKFKDAWKTLEMTAAWKAVHQLNADGEFLMIGDKIHQEKSDPNYYDKMLRALQETSGLSWLGAKSREDVQELLKKSRVGLSWRCESMNDSLEYSTKILEYGGAGCATILNRNKLHESLLGKDYPLYANSQEEFTSKLLLALKDTDILKEAAYRMYELAKKHAFSMRVSELGQWLSEAVSYNKNYQEKIQTVLVASHDLKFFTLLQKELEKTGLYRFIIDQWQGHNKHNEQKSLKLLNQADIIFCEWCLGNLEWYSKHKKTNQKLIARFHAQEGKLPYLENSKLDAIDHISFVSEHIRKDALGKVPAIPLSKTSVIANYLDDKKFTPLKKMGDAQFVLGMIGVTPKGKRLDRAIDLLEALLTEDSRYFLRVKGKNPLSYPWIHNRPEEIEYYKNIFKRINSNPLLRYKVIFDPPGDDINQWLSLVGYILSPSDAESFHMAIGEGVLTGCYPIIWDWEGASQIWGEEFIVKNLYEAVNIILNLKSAVLIGNNSALKMTEKLNASNVVMKWLSVIEDIQEC